MHTGDTEMTTAEMPKQTFKILWPERRIVTANQIRTWYGDGVANGELAAGLRDPDEMARELHSFGTITLAR
jgi:hypothetical protein